MKKLVKYFNDGSLCREGHAFLIGNTTYEQSKDELEEILAKYFFCCGVNIDNDPDIYIVTPEENSITKDQIKQLLSCLSSTSQIHGIKAYVITDVEKLSSSVYNALLKTIEEPEDNIYAFLLTNNIDNVAVTISSRCKKIFVSSNTKATEYDDEIIQYSVKILKSIENNGSRTIATNSEIYKKIEDRQKLDLILKCIFNIYSECLNSKINVDDKEKNYSFIIDNNTIEQISGKIEVVDELIRQSANYISKGIMIDKLIIKLWRCKNESS